MFRMWVSDFEKALKAVHERTHYDLICSIEANLFGDFVVKVDSNTTYIVRHRDFSVIRNYGTWENPNWVEV